MQFVLTGKANDEMQNIGLDRDDVRDCLSGLQLSDLHKDEPDRDLADKRVFVFRPVFNGQELYVKVSMRIDRDHNLAVLSFKLWRG